MLSGSFWQALGFYTKRQGVERLEKSGRKNLRKLLLCKVVLRFVSAGKNIYRSYDFGLYDA